MATYRRKDDPMVSCPYNPAHRMLQSRLQMHLTKCKRDHPQADKKTCPFNAKHRIDSVEYCHHLTVCPDKCLVEKKIAFDANDQHKGNTQVPSYTHNIPASADSEYWDEVPEDYHQTENKKKPNPLYKDVMLLSVMKPAERREYYRSLHARRSEKDEEEASDENFVVQRKELKVLRQPRTQPKIMVENRSPNQPRQTKDDPWKDLYAEDNNNQGLGRGCPSRRIAANIFGHAALESSLYPPHYLTSGMSTLSLGRGKGVLGTASSEGITDYPAL